MLPALRSNGAVDRRLGRDLAGIQAQHVLDQARLAGVTGRVDLGMRAVAHITATETALAQEVPEAAERMRFIADMGTSAIARIVIGDER